MPNTVEVIFQIDAPGTAAAKLKTLDQLTTNIGTSAKATGVKMDAAFKAYTESAERAIRINERNGAAIQQLGGRGEKAAHGLNSVRNALLSIAGIPSLQGVEQMLSAFNPTTVMYLATGAAAIGLVYTAVNSLEESSKALLKVNQDLANVGKVGGLVKMGSDLQGQRDLLDELKQRAAGGQGAISEKEAEQRLGIPDRTWMEKRLIEVSQFREKLGLFTHAEEGQKLMEEYGITLDRNLKKGFSIAEVTLTIEEGMKRQHDIEMSVGALAEKRTATLLQQKQLIDSTSQSLMALQKSPLLTSQDQAGIIPFSGAAERRAREMNAKFQTGMTSEAALDPKMRLKMEQDYAFAKEVLTADIRNETMAVERLVAVRTEELRLQKGLEAAGRDIRKLQITAQGNPLAQIYDQASDRIKSFMETNKDATVNMIRDFTAASDAIKELDLFKTQFGLAQKIGSLFDEREKLRGGMGGADIRSKNADIDSQRTVLKRAINDAMIEGREFGPGGRRELLSQYGSLGMTSTSDRLASEAMQRSMTMGQDALLRAGGNKQAQGLALDQIISSSSNIGMLTTDQIDMRMKALEQKGGLEKESQVDAERKEWAAFRKEIIKVVQQAKSSEAKINVVLKDESGGALKAELGEAPTPESSGAVSSSPFMDSTNAFRNDPMSGRL